MSAQLNDCSDFGFSNNTVLRRKRLRSPLWFLDHIGFAFMKALSPFLCRPPSLCAQGVRSAFYTENTGSDFVGLLPEIFYLWGRGEASE